MRVGIDMDGVMTDFEKYIKEKGSEYLNKDVSNPYGKEIAEIFNVSLEAEEVFWKDHILDYVKNCPPRRDLGKFVRILNSLHIPIVVITNRCNDLSYCGWEEETMKYYVEEWISRNIGPVEKIIYTYGSKVSACLDANIDVMLEDSVEYVKELSSHLSVIKMLAAYNKDCEGKNIFEVSNFDRALETILKLKVKMLRDKGLI